MGRVLLSLLSLFAPLLDWLAGYVPAIRDSPNRAGIVKSVSTVLALALVLALTITETGTVKWSDIWEALGHLAPSL